MDMSKTIYTEVEIDLDEFDDDDLITELETRGYKVLMENQEDEDDDIQEMIWCYKNGKIEDAMVLLERRFPEMYGIHKLIVKQ
jgi:hypothetical protein